MPPLKIACPWAFIRGNTITYVHNMLSILTVLRFMQMIDNLVGKMYIEGALVSKSYNICNIAQDKVWSFLFKL